MSKKNIMQEREAGGGTLETKRLPKRGEEESGLE